jgi:hypothetical protein
VIPPLVAAYLERALPDREAAPLQVRLTQEGHMWQKPRARPRRFTATQHIAIDRVGFSWRARFGVGPFTLAVADGYSDGHGALAVRMFGRTLQHEEGVETSVGEAMRYLAELPWAPAAMAGNGGLSWRELDASNAEVAAAAEPGAPAVTLGFDAVGDIVRASSDARPLRQGDAFVPTAWSGEFGDYRELGGMRMPTSAEVGWDLPDGRFVYWRARVTSALELETPFAPGS